MCRRITCEQCGRPGYAGCGAHIEQVLGKVPAAQRCRCREEAAAGATPTKPRSLRERLFGK